MWIYIHKSKLKQNNYNMLKAFPFDSITGFILQDNKMEIK
jgi:hypothetical protein